MTHLLNQECQAGKLMRLPLLLVFTMGPIIFQVTLLLDNHRICLCPRWGVSVHMCTCRPISASKDRLIEYTITSVYTASIILSFPFTCLSQLNLPTCPDSFTAIPVTGHSLSAKAQFRLALQCDPKATPCLCSVCPSHQPSKTPTEAPVERRCPILTEWRSINYAAYW